MNSIPRWVVATGVALVVVLAASMLYVPYDMRTSLGCPYCGATATRRRVFLVPLPLQVRQGPLTHYWRAHVEHGHVHTWVPRETFERLPGGGGIHRSHPACLHPRWTYLKDEVVIAVLRGLPTRRERRKFVQAVWNGGNDTTQVTDLCIEVRMAYDEDPARRDWRAILRKNGVRL